MQYTEAWKEFATSKHAALAREPGDVRFSSSRIQTLDNSNAHSSRMQRSSMTFDMPATAYSDSLEVFRDPVHCFMLTNFVEFLKYLPHS